MLHNYSPISIFIFLRHSDGCGKCSIYYFHAIKSDPGMYIYIFIETFVFYRFFYK